MSGFAVILTLMPGFRGKVFLIKRKKSSRDISLYYPNCLFCFCKQILFPLFHC